MRVAILWSELSGYMNACFRALSRMEGVELFVVNKRPAGDAPFNETMFAWMTNRYQWEDMPDAGELIPRLEQFRPDVILCANWHHKGYRKALRHFRGRAVRIFTSDRPWLGTARQWLGVLVSRFYLRPLCEAIFVAGEPHAAWARKMGFRQQDIFQGLLSCDHERFSAIHFERKERASWPRIFVFVGRFAPEKGLDVLARAYEIYRENTAEPWPLKCYGVGPLQHMVERVKGIECRGFCQPDDLPAELRQASCLILPSTYDGWAIVVHEAVSAGMAAIVTDAVGASVHLVRDGHNGYVVEAGSAEELAQAMLRYGSLGDGERSLMGENSYRLSLQYTPERWANTLVSKSMELMANPGKSADNAVRMNILHVTPSCYPATCWGGPIFTVYAMNDALAKIPGVRLTILTTDTAGPLLSQRLNSAQLAGLYPNQEMVMTRRIAGASVSPGLLWRLPALIRRADVVHLTAIYSFSSLPTLLLCRLLNKPLVWSPHGAIQDAHEWSGTRKRRIKRIWEKMCNALLREGRAIAHVTSERERVPTQDRLPKARAVLVPNGVDIPDDIAPRAWMPGGELRLMYLGRLSPKKGLENLLHALARLDDPGISLSIYGGGESNYADSLRRLATSLGIMGRMVSFMGHVDGSDKAQAFQRADVCVVPSHTESFCMVVAEALAHGVPVIASRGTPWQRVEEEGCGLWVDNRPESLAQAIIAIRSRDVGEMGRRGRAWMKQEFSWPAVSAKMLEIYRSLMAAKG